MPKASKEVWKNVNIRPLSGILDTRSEPDAVPLGAFRYKSNFQLTGGSKLCTRPGHDRFFASSSPYTNYDLHDQGDINQVGIVPQPITMLFKSTFNTGARVFYAGTQSQIKWLDETTGLCTTVVYGLGGARQPGLPATRFRAAELQQQILFTNNVDQPLLSAVGSSSAATIPDLVTLNVTKAAITIQYAGFLFLMDVFQDGVRQSSRVRWSDLNKPTKWIPCPSDAGSLAGFQDLDYGSQILGATIMANSLYIFTSQAIWTCYPSGTSLGGADNCPATFGFTRIYSEPKNGAKCLAYPNTLVSQGNAVWYGATDGIYTFTPYTPEPERPEWLYRASSAIFNDKLSALNRTCCQSPVAEIHPDDQEIYFSWPEVSANPGGTCINSKSLIFNYAYRSTDIVDYGYSAFCNELPNQGDLEACPPNSIFVGASMSDLTLKEIGTIFSRTECTNASTGKGTIVNGAFVPFTGAYATRGYYRILRGLLPTLNYDRKKFIRQFLIEAIAQDQAVPCVLKVRIGNSYSESDPNMPDSKCSVIWRDLPPLPLKCPASMTGSQYASANLEPNRGIEWTLLVSGYYLYYSITIANPDGSPAIGGDACFPALAMEIRLSTK